MIPKQTSEVSDGWKCQSLYFQFDADDMAFLDENNARLVVLDSPCVKELDEVSV